MSLSQAQHQAVHTDGNVLVVAGAGAGKTRTLVERCLSRVLNPTAPVNLDEILMVTFTEAAAAEVKFRIRQRLSQALPSDVSEPARHRLQEQLALLDTAHISTLHSFCLELIRQHFHELALDPQLTVLEKQQVTLIMEETLDVVFEPHYAGTSAAGAAVQELIEVQANGRVETIRKLVLKLHHFTQTLPDPTAWFRNQKLFYDQPQPSQWIDWLLNGFSEWRDRWVPVLTIQPNENERAHSFAVQLAGLPATFSRADAAKVLGQIVAADQEWHGNKGQFRKVIEEFYEEAAFLHSLMLLSGDIDPLAEDWMWVRQQMGTLLNLTEEFSRAFAAAKREQGVIDFHDFEQFALRLLWDTKANGPTPLAQHWREQFKLILVDEYQDINAAQDMIIRALSREGPAANRFLVGDVKQSIYRFRLAAPHIFQGYKADWEANPSLGRVIPLAENFRSRERLLEFVNPIFAELMQPQIGGVAYDQQAMLKFGAPKLRAALATAADPQPCVEVHLRMAANSKEKDEDSAVSPDIAELTKVELEARLVARRLRDLKTARHPVWDDQRKTFRPVEWRDMAILLRSPAGRAEAYAKEFTRLNVPLEASRGGFYDSTEITDLLSLLLLLDNPLQDVPALAVLRSPLVGLSLDELAEIRLVNRETYFWTALTRWHEIQSTGKAGETFRKVDALLERFWRWRRMARETSLSQRLEAVLNETHYCDWLLTQTRGEQRQANVRRLLALAQQFDPFQRQGLQRFLRFVQAQQEAEIEIEPAPIEAAQAVTLTSIHRSKGLEFPIVVLADLGKAFNFRDLYDGVILDEEYGLCPQIRPPLTGRHYPSLPCWLARLRQKRETLGEELRLLYVAMTRTRDLLLLVGTTSKTVATERWPEEAALPPGERRIVSANSLLNWLGPWLTRQIGAADWAACREGSTELFRWTIHTDEADLRAQESERGPTPATSSMLLESTLTGTDPRALQQLQELLEWRYQFSAATAEPAKLNISEVRSRLDADSRSEAPLLFPLAAPVPTAPLAQRTRLKSHQAETSTAISAAEIGTAHHLFLQMVSLDQVESVQDLKSQAEQMTATGVLSEQEAASLDFPALLAFWQSQPGGRILRQATQVHREIPFRARFSKHDLTGLHIRVNPDLAEDEFFVGRGMVDLAVILPNEIWLVDFKTDQVTEQQLPERIRLYTPQLKLYGLALSRIYQRPATEHWLHFLSLGRTLAI